MALTYTTLLERVQDTLSQYDEVLIANLPTIVRQAEESIYNSVLLPALRRNVTGQLTQNNKYLTMPTDFLATYSLAVVDSAGVYVYLTNKDVSFIREAYPNPGSIGQPKYYALFDDNAFIVGPTPNEAYQAELHYYYYPPSIVDTGTSWVAENFEHVLFYGVMVKAYIFMKGEADVLAMYEKQYMEALAQLERLGRGLNRQDEFRSGFRKAKV